MNEMNDEFLITRGYEQYKPLQYRDSDIVVARFQKCFKDSFGKRYFLDVIKWTNDYVPPSHRIYGWQPYSYTYEIYTTMYKDEKPMDLKFNSEWTLEEVERFANDFFDKMKPNYYESWDGVRASRPDF